MLEISMVLMATGRKGKLDLVDDTGQLYRILGITFVDINGTWVRYISVENISTGTVLCKAPNRFENFKLAK